MSSLFLGIKDYSSKFHIYPVAQINGTHSCITCIFKPKFVFSDFLQTWASIVQIYVLPVPLSQGCQNSDVPLVYLSIAQSLFDTVTPWVDINANRQKEVQAPYPSIWYLRVQHVLRDSAPAPEPPLPPYLGVSGPHHHSS